MEYNYENFRDSVLNKLIDYKNNVLKIKKNGIYSRNKKEYPHILPKEKEIHNLIHSEYSIELWDLIKRFKIGLHKDFHHLNSSQALCFNLFYPVIKENKFKLLFDKNENITGWKFEFVPDKNENTNFDVFIQTDKNNYYFEIKYTEYQFDSKSKNEIYIKRYNDIYKEKLKIFNNLTIDSFFKNYQIFRNLCYLDNGIINFVFPKSRIDLDKKLNSIINKYCNDTLKKRINIIYIDDIIKKAIRNNELVDYYKLFSEKYM
jgi:hypothetical protein